MATAAKPTSSTYEFFNCFKCGMSLMGPDTKLRFHPRDTGLGYPGNTIEFLWEVIFPPPYTGTFSNLHGLKILAEGKEKYSSEYQESGDFYIKFQVDGFFRVERKLKHECAPLPKLTREQALVIWQNRECCLNLSDVTPEDLEWLYKQSGRPFAVGAESISCKERPKTPSDTSELASKSGLVEAHKIDPTLPK
jgi:hypothetical protein